MHYVLALFLLGAIQGLTEFLPVSSSGHLVLFSKIFGVEESLFLSILLHVATLFSIIVVFYKDIWQLIRHPFSKLSLQIVVATIPTCLIVLILMPLIKQSFMGGFLPICFVVSACLLLLAEYFSKKKKESGEFDFKIAIIMGIAQGFAVFPGISRSGTTISAGLLQGKNKEEVAKFSFLMSIPIILLSLFMEIYEVVADKVVVNLPVGATILAFVTAFLVGVFAIKVMMKLTSKANLKWFAYELVVVAVVSLFFL